MNFCSWYYDCWSILAEVLKRTNSYFCQLLVAGHQNYRILEPGDFLETEDFLEMDSSASQSVVVVSPVGPGGILLEVQNRGAHPRPSESESALYKLRRGLWYTVTSEKAESILSGPLHPAWASCPEWALHHPENVPKRNRVLSSARLGLGPLSSFQRAEKLFPGNGEQDPKNTLRNFGCRDLSLLEQVSLLRKTWWWSLHLRATSPSSKWMASFYGNLGYRQHWARVGRGVRRGVMGLPWRSSGQDSMLSLQGVQVQPLVGGLGSCVLWDQKKKKVLNWIKMKIQHINFKKLYGNLYYHM